MRIKFLVTVSYSFEAGDTVELPRPLAIQYIQHNLAEEVQDLDIPEVKG